MEHQGKGSSTRFIYIKVFWGEKKSIKSGPERLNNRGGGGQNFPIKREGLVKWVSCFKKGGITN